MDNLTHSLAGAVLGQMGLKKKTGLGMATLIIAANIPDIDAFAVLLGGHEHLRFRRGLTHGPIAMVVLPLILTGIMIWFDGWQTRRGTRPEGRLPIHKGWLLALAFIGTLSHPALDWLNVYGIRFLEPFSDKWYAGDTIFIIDIWIWAALALGLFISIRRERRGTTNWQRPAWISFAAICAYVFANGAITGKAETETTAELKSNPELAIDHPALEVVASPIPVKFWVREMFWRDEKIAGEGLYNWPKGVTLSDDVQQTNMDHPAIAVAREIDPQARDYLFWSRMPMAVIKETTDQYEIKVIDQRFGDPLTGDRFTLRTAVPKDRLEPAEE